MAYSNFKTVVEVASKFDIQVADKSTVIKQKEANISIALYTLIANSINDGMSFINEVAICERVISPILNAVAENYTQLKVWSHVAYNIDEQQGLIGEPDYLIAPRTKYGGMAKPSLCIIEAKRDNFDEGWAQALAEMVASSLSGADSCYGIVTTGKMWEFGKLENNVFTVDPVSVSATDNLQKTFNSLNWVFDKVSKLS
ncbi:hypothetical protein [Candidatus Venteria ishoeyi]|uniref:Type I restriction enzyme R protein N-terminal domain-containing protein n=1 Tax=Candidatus Venteria ishoeyi TaxID=1899563 RepID=A0A1H6F3H9_9GAMM|nr:hypothetical protein [Candidatus Venteria ishoeyi]SEH04707.1 Uncharacterised protein [Candidatus Venteria ishoeyi]